MNINANLTLILALTVTLTLTVTTGMEAYMRWRCGVKTETSPIRAGTNAQNERHDCKCCDFISKCCSTRLLTKSLPNRYSAL